MSVDDVIDAHVLLRDFEGDVHQLIARFDGQAALSEAPRFAHASEAELARILDYYKVAWQYEPHVFPIRWNSDGVVVESFAPDFYLPELELYVELTTLKQSLVRKKNRKLRHLRELYPMVRIKLFYARDFRALLLKYGRLDAAASLIGIDGQPPPRRGRPHAAEAARAALRAASRRSAAARPAAARPTTDHPAHHARRSTADAGISPREGRRRGPHRRDDAAGQGGRAGRAHLGRLPRSPGDARERPQGRPALHGRPDALHPLPVRIDLMEVSSYGGATETSGQVRILKDLSSSIEGEDVLIVEDIIDTGLTLNYLTEYLRGKDPASLRICALLDKPARRLVDIDIAYRGFEIPDRFVIGYGLDYGEIYRNLPYIGVLRPEVYGGE